MNRRIAIICGAAALFIAAVVGIGFACGWLGGEKQEEDSQTVSVTPTPTSTPTPTPTPTPTQPPLESEPVEPTEEPYVSPIDFAGLWAVNPEIYAWLEIPGTEVAYPICRRESDDAYYLNHTIEGAEGLPGAIYTETAYNGTDFSEFNTVVYGHNMRNRTMFGSLKDFRDESFLQSHREIVVYTPEAEYHFTVFAAVIYGNQHLLSTYDNESEEDRARFLESLGGGRVLDDVEVTPDSHLITLSTCVGGQPDNRFLVIGALNP